MSTKNEIVYMLKVIASVSLKAIGRSKKMESKKKHVKPRLTEIRLRLTLIVYERFILLSFSSAERQRHFAGYRSRNILSSNFKTS